MEEDSAPPEKELVVATLTDSNHKLICLEYPGKLLLWGSNAWCMHQVLCVDMDHDLFVYQSRGN